MDLCRKHPTRRFEAGDFTAFADTVVNETRIELDINDGQLRVAMLCLPRELEALAIGFLLGEGALRCMEDLKEAVAHPEQKKVVIRGNLDSEAMDMLAHRWTWGSGCGGGGTGRDLDRPSYNAVGPGTAVDPASLLELLRRFERSLELWRQTGGVHACALVAGEELLLLTEDVGRHNAFDKIMGMAAMQGITVEDKYAITTGRLSAEIVSKAVACGLPMLVSRCAVTGLAVDLGRQFGVTLVGFGRGKRLNVYTGYQRVVQTDAAH